MCVCANFQKSVVLEVDHIETDMREREIEVERDFELRLLRNNGVSRNIQHHGYH